MINFLFSAGILLLNIPFGIWRQRVKRYGLQWVLAIHIPVLIIITGRFIFNFPYQIEVLPFNILSFFLGQYLGSRISVFCLKSCS